MASKAWETEEMQIDTNEEMGGSKNNMKRSVTLIFLNSIMMI